MASMAYSQNVDELISRAIQAVKENPPQTEARTAHEQAGAESPQTTVSEDGLVKGAVVFTTAFRPQMDRGRVREIDECVLRAHTRARTARARARARAHSTH